MSGKDHSIGATVVAKNTQSKYGLRYTHVHQARQALDKLCRFSFSKQAVYNFQILFLNLQLIFDNDDGVDNIGLHPDFI